MSHPPAHRSSSVLSFPAPSPAESADYMRAKLGFHTDAWDVAEDLLAGCDDIVVLDTRAEAAYLEAHVPGALSLKRLLQQDPSLVGLDRSKVYVTYCDGIGCNGSTKGAYALASRGFQVKEMLGGLDFWKRDGFPLAQGSAPGRLQGESLIACSCA
ncbi:rhodanese-like domain-containing protein [Paucibacter sp. APW11]|uniref:Rhodanese-like domain-containing protein n=1 Tax=Roseateles aquae TaxID=3077235 RepID=A0ABU3PIS6_9BURK|nr:rhodanese-like domain-containing protein [Paucibacter sp. APW11]MDT9002433.1 rhodanese-like domain-containing protein [Paucibacter sp. APW11]